VNANRDSAPALVTRQRTGVVLAGAGALLMSADTLLIRLASADSMLTVVFWRGVMSFCIACAAGLCVPAARNILRVSAGRRAFWFASACYGIASFMFVCALGRTSVASALVIVSCAPLSASLLSLVFLKETTPLLGWLTMLAALGGISLVGTGGGDHASGNLLAAASALALSSAFVIARGARVDTTFAPALGGLLAAIAVLPFLADVRLAHAAQWGWMVLDGAVLLPTAFAMIAASPRFIPAPQVGVLLLLETALGPFWTGWALGEIPDVSTQAGGVIVVTAVLLFSWGNLRQSTRTRRSRRMTMVGNKPE
jgi:drug/metabolite transporter (DMT)-like permease